MGLDITYYRHTERLRDVPEDGEYDYEKGEFAPYVNKAFAEQADGLTTGVYIASEGDGFRAGSYSGYDRWRRQLADMAGYSDMDAFEGLVGPDKPFLPLVNFSDCEGLIGPVTSARLARDFADKQPLADTHPDEHFRALYAKWRVAFETAADSGLVNFH